MWQKFLDSCFEHVFPHQQIRAYLDPFRFLSDEEAVNPQVVRLHGRILRWSIVTGLVTSLGWTLLLLFVLIRNMNPRDSDGWMLLLAIPALAIGLFFFGTFVGAAAALAITPAWFLLGPGKRWIKFIGTRNIVVARVVCVASAVLSCPILLLPFVAICFLVFR